MKYIKRYEDIYFNDKVITTTYQTITPGIDWDEPDEENGWYDEKGESMIPDEYDKEEGITAVDKAVYFLKNDKYATEPSSSEFHVGISYSTSDPEHNYSTGEETYYTCHLNGFTKEEEFEIYKKITNWEEKQLKKAVNKYNL